MAKSKNVSGFLSELLAVGLYKRNQGRLTRQLSAAAFALIVFLGAWNLAQGPLNDYDRIYQIGIPSAIALVGGWMVYRLVNYPRFADFLISVEAEMDKVTWSSKAELYRATVVVLVTMFLMGAILFVFDVFWQNFFEWIGFLEISAT